MRLKLPESLLARLLIVAAGLLLLSEVGLRVFIGYNSRWDVRLGADKQLDPVTQFRNKPFFEIGPGYLTNELGYRAPPHLQRELPAHSLRLVYLGDSASVLPRLDNYPKQVETLLEPALGVDVETVNAAVPGFSSENARLLFETELSQFDGHYFFVYLGWNDLGQYGPEGLPYKRHETGYPISPLERALSSLYTPRFFYAAAEVLRHYESTVNRALSPQEEALYAAYRPDHFYNNLHAILSLARRRYPRVYVMTLATITNADPTDEEMRKAHFPTGMDRNIHKLDVLVSKFDDAVRTVAREENVPLIDLHALFDSHEARQHFRDSCHMDEVGAGRVARAVADTILEREAERPSVPGEAPTPFAVR